MKKTIFRNEKGFALLAAILASMILLAVGLLAINLSVGDQRASVLSVGDKKAMSATESGIHTLVQTFSDDAATWTAAHNYTTNCSSILPSYVWRSISAGIDASTEFAVCAPNKLNAPPVAVAGYELDQWAIYRYNATVIGRNTTYNAMHRVSIGIGFGPVPTK